MLTSLLVVAHLQAADKPNVVLILVDDLGWTDLACQGSRFYETPHLDRLAAEGVRFTNGYAACAVCSPTRAAVQTGRYPHRTGVTDWIRSRFQGGAIPQNKQNPCWRPPGEWKGNRKLLVPPNAIWMESEEVTIAEALRPAGYASCYIGKWHLGTDPWYPTQQGYDFNYGGCDYGQPPSYFDPFNQPNGRHETLRRGIHGLPGRRPGEYLTDREADEAVAFIEAHKDTPFFLMLAHYAVHTPIQAKEDVTAKYLAKPKTNQSNAKYAAMVESVDDAAGRVMETLERLELTDKTLVIFTSDNGGLSRVTDNSPLRSGKGYPFEGGIRVPFIVRWPGVARAGATVDDPVISMDLLPTIAAAANVELPRGVDIDGCDLRPLLTGKGSLERDALYWHFPHYRHNPGPYSIIREGDWKLIKWYEGQTSLFNLKDDLGETQDLAQEMPDKVRELDAKLMAHLQQTTKRIPIANPGWKGTR